MTEGGGTFRALVVLAGFLVAVNAQVGASNGEIAIGSLSGGSFKEGALTVNAPGVNFADRPPNQTNGQEDSNAPNTASNQGGSINEANGQQSNNAPDDGSNPSGPTNEANGQEGNYAPDAGSNQGGPINEANGQQSNNAPDAGSNPSESSNPGIVIGGATADSTSFAADKITGGSYPNQSFSIGHGQDSTGSTGQTNYGNNANQGSAGNFGESSNPGIVIGGATADSTSFAADKVIGGSYPNQSFSVGHGQDSTGSTGQTSYGNNANQGSAGNFGESSNPGIVIGGATADSTSFAADKITGGSYPNQSFSIGHGQDSTGSTGQTNYGNNANQGSAGNLGGGIGNNDVNVAKEDPYGELNPSREIGYKQNNNGNSQITYITPQSPPLFQGRPAYVAIVPPPETVRRPPARSRPPQRPDNDGRVPYQDIINVPPGTSIRSPNGKVSIGEISGGLFSPDAFQGWKPVE